MSHPIVAARGALPAPAAAHRSGITRSRARAVVAALLVRVVAAASITGAGPMTSAAGGAIRAPSPPTRWATLAPPGPSPAPSAGSPRGLVEVGSTPTGPCDSTRAQIRLVRSGPGEGRHFCCTGTWSDCTATRNVPAYANEGDGSPERPWTGWESAFTSIPPTGAAIRFAAGRYTERSAVRLPTNLAGRLRIQGQRGARILLTPGAPRAFSISKRADYDVLRHVLIENLWIDGGRLTGKNSVVLGDYENGADTMRLSFEDITIRKVHADNVLVDPTIASHEGFVRLDINQSGGETRPVFVRDVRIEDCTFVGGNWGILIDAPATNASNARIENVIIRNTVHDMRVGSSAVQSGIFPSSCIQVGQNGLVGRVRLDRDTCFAPGDDCFEVNNAQEARLENLDCYDPVSAGIVLVNYTPPLDARSEVYSVENSRVTLTASPPPGATPFGISNYLGSGAFGTLEVANFSYSAAPGLVFVPGPALASTGGVAVRRIVARGVRVSVPRSTKAGTADLFWSPIEFNDVPHDWNGDGTAELPDLTLRKMTMDLHMDETGGRTFIRPILVLGSGRLDIDGLRMNVSTNSDDGFAEIFIGGGGGTGPARVGGRIANVALTLEGPRLTARQGVFVDSTDHVVVEPSLTITSRSDGSLADRIDPTNTRRVLAPRD